MSPQPSTSALVHKYLRGDAGRRTLLLGRTPAASGPAHREAAAEQVRQPSIPASTHTYVASVLLLPREAWCHDSSLAVFP